MSDRERERKRIKRECLFTHLRLLHSLMFFKVKTGGCVDVSVCARITEGVQHHLIFICIQIPGAAGDESRRDR